MQRSSPESELPKEAVEAMRYVFTRFGVGRVSPSDEFLIALAKAAALTPSPLPGEEIGRLMGEIDILFNDAAALTFFQAGKWLVRNKDAIRTTLSRQPAPETAHPDPDIQFNRDHAKATARQEGWCRGYEAGKAQAMLGWNEAIKAAAQECERLADIFNKDDRRAETHALERTIAAIRALTRPATDTDRIGILD